MPDNIISLKFLSDGECGYAEGPTPFQTFHDDLFDIFIDRIKEDQTFREQLWGALANVVWVHTDKKYKVTMSFRFAAELIAELGGNHTDSYLNYYLCYPYASVTEEINQKLSEKGWCPRRTKLSSLL